MNNNRLPVDIEFRELPPKQREYQEPTNNGKSSGYASFIYIAVFFAAAVTFWISLVIYRRGL